MTAFEGFPCYDVIFEISNFLSLDDVVHLSQTCRQLRILIFSNEQVARKVVAVCTAAVYMFTKLTLVADTPLLHRRSFGCSHANHKLQRCFVRNI